MPAAAWDTSRRGVFRLYAGALLAFMLACSGSLVVSLQPGVARAASPTITILSPTSASGPVETHMQLSGAGWKSGANVQLYYSQPANNQPCGDPNTAQSQASAHPFGNGLINVQSNGSWTVQATQWPDNTGTGQFYICGFDVTSPTQVVASNKQFNVLSNTPPSLDAPQPAFPNIGDQVQISGHGFLPGNQPVDLWLTQTPNNPTQGASLGTVTSDGTGSFTQQVTLPTNLSGNLNIVAQSRTSVNGAPAPLVASVDVTVGATASTPTATPTGSATPDPTATVRATATPASAGTGGSSGSSAGKTILAFLLVLLTLVILAIFGVLIWYFLGIRPPAGAAPPLPSSASRTRPPASSPQRGPARRQSQAGWQDDDWEDQQGPWEEDDQGGWGDAGYAPGQRGPGSGAHSREDWRNRSRQGPDGW